MREKRPQVTYIVSNVQTTQHKSVDSICWSPKQLALKVSLLQIHTVPLKQRPLHIVEHRIVILHAKGYQSLKYLALTHVQAVKFQLCFLCCSNSS